MSASIITIDDVRVRTRCPKCAKPITKRESKEQGEKSTLNGASLFTLSEQCNMCGWAKVHSNVRLGV